MGKRRDMVIRTAKQSNFTDNLRVGDTITGEDMLGIDRRVTDELPPPGWLRGEASPFGMDVFDCRAVALTSVAATSDPNIPGTFSRLRQSDGREHINMFPEAAIGLEVNLDIDLHGFDLKDGPLFKAEQMEDKWDIYYYAPVMYFVRSWTGILAHAALCREHDGILTLDTVATAAELLDQRDRTFFIRVAFFLIVNHVLGAVYPHPIPSYRAGDDESILVSSFSEFGRRGWYATVPEARDSDTP